jgi:hypothetical protein
MTLWRKLTGWPVRSNFKWSGCFSLLLAVACSTLPYKKTISVTEEWINDELSLMGVISLVQNADSSFYIAPRGLIETLGINVGLFKNEGNDCDEIAIKTMTEGIKIYERKRYSLALFRISMAYDDRNAHEANVFVGDDLNFYYFDAMTRRVILLKYFLSDPHIIKGSVEVFR